MILRIILRRKVTKRSDANLGRGEKTMLELDQSSLEGSFDQGFNTEKVKRNKKRGYKNGKRRNKTSKSRN